MICRCCPDGVLHAPEFPEKPVLAYIPEYRAKNPAIKSGQILSATTGCARKYGPLVKSFSFQLLQ